MRRDLCLQWFMPVRAMDCHTMCQPLCHTGLCVLLAGGCSILLKMPESKVVGVRHRFVRKQGLSDPSVMQQWMANPASSLSSSGSMSDEGSSTSCEGARVRVSVCPAGVSSKAAGVPAPGVNIAATPAL